MDLEDLEAPDAPTLGTGEDMLTDLDVENFALVASEPSAVSTPAQLHELEEESYQWALLAGDAEWRMVLALAEIRDQGLWKFASDEPGFTFVNYMSEWMGEVRARAAEAAKAQGLAVPALPYSVSWLQKKLALHRRFVGYFGCPPEKVLGASLDVMTKFAATLAKRWDYKSGAPLEVNPEAHQGLVAEFPEADSLQERVQQAVDVIATCASPGQALEYIKDKFAPKDGSETLYNFQVYLWNGAPFVRVEVVEMLPDGVVKSSQWYDWNAPWPEAAAGALAKRLSTNLRTLEGEGAASDA